MLIIFTDFIVAQRCLFLGHPFPGGDLEITVINDRCCGGFPFIIGLAFGPVCILLFINLVVAALIHFGTGGGLGDVAHAIEDAVMFAGLIFIGPGKYSIDKK